MHTGGTDSKDAELYANMPGPGYEGAYLDSEKAPGDKTFWREGGVGEAWVGHFYHCLLNVAGEIILFCQHV